MTTDEPTEAQKWQMRRVESLRYDHLGMYGRGDAADNMRAAEINPNPLAFLADVDVAEHYRRNRLDYERATLAFLSSRE